MFLSWALIVVVLSTGRGLPVPRQDALSESSDPVPPFSYQDAGRGNEADAWNPDQVEILPSSDEPSNAPGEDSDLRKVDWNLMTENAAAFNKDLAMRRKRAARLKRRSPALAGKGVAGTDPASRRKRDSYPQSLSRGELEDLAQKIYQLYARETGGLPAAEAPHPGILLVEEVGGDVAGAPDLAEGIDEAGFELAPDGADGVEVPILIEADEALPGLGDSAARSGGDEEAASLGALEEAGGLYPLAVVPVPGGAAVTPLDGWPELSPYEKAVLEEAEAVESQRLRDEVELSERIALLAAMLNRYRR